MLVPLQMGVPGGPELLVLLVVALFVFGIPLALVAVGVILYRNRSGGRVEQLEARIDELEQELERERRGGDND